ncbi:MAG: alkaline phosphatase family protein [Bacteroidales bacterium]|jgi:hypothetical protein
MKKLAFILILVSFLTDLHGKDKFKTKNIVLITLDGLRWQELFTGADPVLTEDPGYVKNIPKLKADFWDESQPERRKKLMPFIWTTVAGQGQIYGNRGFDNKVDLTNMMWFSYPGYNEILTGKPDDKRINSNDAVNNPNVTVLEYLNRQPEYKGKIAAFGSWNIFPYIINEERSKIPVNAGFETAEGDDLSDMEMALNILQPEVPSPWETVRLDAFTHHYAFEYLKKDRPKIIYIAYGETDDFAHDKEYDSYLHSAARADDFIRQLWEWVQSQPGYKDQTTMIITTDHGRGLKDEWTSHGSKYSHSDETWFAVIGPDVPARGEIRSPGQYYNNQYASTIAMLLGYDFQKEHEAGDPLDILFIQ